MTDLFAQYTHLVVFLHVFSAVVWIGGMVAVRGVAHPVLQRIESPELRLEKTLEVTGRLFHWVMPFILTLGLTAVVMVAAADAHTGDQGFLFVLKEGIWSIMTVNFAYMYLLRRRAWHLFRSGDLSGAKRRVRLLPNVLLPVNVLLGLAALWLGITLRGL